MKTKLIATLFIFSTLNSFAQSGKSPLKDDLLKDKQVLLSNYIPMANGQYLYKFYVLPPNEVIDKMNNFKSALDSQIDAEQNTEVKALKVKDADFFTRTVLKWYMGLYGMDSVGMVNFEKVATEKKNDPNYNDLLISAQKKAFITRLSIEERARLTDIINKNPDLNDEVLYKRSAAYRMWVDDYIMQLRQTKYRADTTLGYEGINVVKLKVINNEVTNVFIKEYLSYETVCTILKMVRNVAAKEEAYRTFMATATNHDYKEEVKVIYDNFKRMSSNAFAPNFIYTSVDNKQVSLKDLRGKYVYIDVWATWCAPCKGEIPFLTKVEEDYHGKNIYFVSLSVDKIADRPKWVNYVKDHKLQGIQLMADKDFNSDFIKSFVTIQCDQHFEI